MCWKQHSREGRHKQQRTAISPLIPATPLGAHASTLSSSSALLIGWGLPDDSSAVLNPEEKQAQAWCATRNGNWWLREVPGIPSLSCTFQGKKLVNLCRNNCRGEKCCSSAWCFYCCSLEGIFSCTQPLSSSGIIYSRAANCLETLKNYRS